MTTTNLRQRLSANFTLDEFLVSQTALRHGIAMHPPANVVHNLGVLCQAILQPVRDEFGAVVITSGYRPKQLNRRIGSSDRSQHIVGEAADFKVPGYTPLEICEFIRDAKLPYHQLIHEFGSWTHASVAPGRTPRNQLLTLWHNGQRTVASNGLLDLAEVEVAA